jgi:sugar lactone lactonase YvrE
MKIQFFKQLAALLFACVLNAFSGTQVFVSESVEVSDFVGSEFYGYVDGVGDKTMFQPLFDTSGFGRSFLYMTVNPDGEIFLLDGSGLQRRMRKITQNALVSTFGDPTKVPTITSMVHNGVDGFYVWNYSRNAILKLSQSTFISEIYKAEVQSEIAKILGGFASGMCVDSQGGVYISSFKENKIFKINANGTYEVFAGSGNSGRTDGNGIFTSFSGPDNIVCDSFDNVYVNDSGNQCIRKIDKSKNVTTFSGIDSLKQYNDGDKQVSGVGVIKGMSIDKNGNVFISTGKSIKMLDVNGTLKSIAGNYSSGGYKNGSGQTSLFNQPIDLVCYNNLVFVYDTTRIRKITIGQNSIKKPVGNISIKLSAGITINGTVGKKYTIESSSNGGKEWNGLIELDLTKSPYTWYDENAVGTNNLYRVFESP